MAKYTIKTHFLFNPKTGIIEKYEKTGKQVKIPAVIGGIAVKGIGDGVFANCTKLRKVIIPDSVKTIGYNAFLACEKLKRVRIPYSVETIGGSAFLRCTRLTEINVDKDNLNYASEDGILFDKSKTVLIKYPERKTNAFYSIPHSVEIVESGAFVRCKYLGEVIIPGNVIEIRSSVFSSCRNLREVKIGGSVKTIGSYVFADCESLTTLTIPASVTDIGMGAFRGCYNLFEVRINKNNLSYSSDGGIIFNKDKTRVLHYLPGRKDTVDGLEEKQNEL